jgi:hypothetical protein
MQEVEYVCHGWTEALDSKAIQAGDLAEQLILTGCRQAVFEELAEGPFVRIALVDVRNPQFGLPIESMCGTLEHLFLLSDAIQQRFKGGTTKIAAELACAYFLHDFLHATPNTPEGLQPF